MGRLTSRIQYCSYVYSAARGDAKFSIETDRNYTYEIYTKYSSYGIMTNMATERNFEATLCHKFNLDRSVIK